MGERGVSAPSHPAAGARSAWAQLVRLAARWQGHWGWVALPVLALPALAPLLSRGLLRSHDIPNHLLRLLNFHEQLSAGQLYPRWVPDLALGYGYPLYNFYAPASYYVLEAFRWLGGNPALAFLLAFGALMLIAALGMWHLARDLLRDLDPHFSHWLALLAATSYLYGPYLLTNVYIRGALAELMAQALLPWTLWAFRRVLVAPANRVYQLAAALLLGLIMVSHTISLVFIPPFVAAYVLLAGPARRLPWRALSTAGLGALGVSAFFWLPVIVERSYLGPGALNYAYEWLPINLLDWHNFTDWSLTFKYRYVSPFQMGLTQCLLAAAGFVLARRRSREWVFLALAALGLCLLTTRLAEPLWLSVKPAASVQFPWRLFSVAGLPLALLPAGLLVAVRRPALRAVAAILLIGLTMYAHLPRVEFVEAMPDNAHELNVATIAQYEQDTSDIGLSANGRQVSSDFAPRWVNLYAGLRGYPPAAEALATEGVAVTLTAASQYEWRLALASDQPTTLRLTGFYFPGWRAWLDETRAVRVYPSTDQGLLTVDVPAGQHTLRVAWVGSGTQWAATSLSWLTLAALAAWAWTVLKPRTLAALPATALAVGVLAAAFGRAPLGEVLQPPALTRTAGLELLGLRTTPRAEALELRPFWYVRAAPDDLELRWMLVNAAGQTLSTAQTRPYFDTLPAYSWRPGTLVDDAYRLPLPPGLPAGDYQLWLCPVTAAAPAAACAERHLAATLALPAVTAPAALPPAAQPFSASFNGELTMGGLTLVSSEEALPQTTNGLHVAQAGQQLDYTLFWRTLGRVSTNYHGFIHLLDAGGQKRAGHDDILGAYYYPPRLWDPFYWTPDTYAVALPSDLPSGVYQPVLGLYDFTTLATVPAENGSAVVPLPAIKVMRQPVEAPAQPLAAGFDGLGQLKGYTLATPAGGVQAGSTLTLTVHYQAQGGDPRDLREFVHLYAPELGLAAQHDGQPQQATNPTWAWVADEWVTSTITLQIDPAARPGAYHLLLGFYDPGAGNQRVPARDANAQPFADHLVPLTIVEIGA